jgi:hemerythrin
MGGIKWEARFSVENDFIDDQHKTIIEHINKFYTASKTENWDECHRILEGMLEFVVKHFKDEEGFMERANFKDLPVHKMIHNELIEKATNLASSFKDHPCDDTATKINHFLNFWIKSHICGIDMNYKEEIKKIS